MTPQASLKLVGEVRDLQIIDSGGSALRNCRRFGIRGRAWEAAHTPWHIGGPWGL